MANIKLGDMTYWGVQAVRLDAADGSTMDFAPYEETFAAGKAEGIQMEYDRFWDAYQDNGNRTDYDFAFAGKNWGAAGLLPPKYPISAGTDSSFVQMFAQFNRDISWVPEPYDMTEVSKKLDLSKALNLYKTFDSAYCKNLTVDVSGSTNLGYAFAQLNGAGVRSLWVKIGEGANLENTFTYNNSLQELTLLEGSVIAKTIQLVWSTMLSVASMKSVITHLKNYSGTADAGTKTVKFAAACWTALESDGTTAPDGNTWRDYVETTLGWLT